MTVEVHSQHKWVILSADGFDDLRHEVPRRTRYFKEELRLYREEIRCWLRGRDVEELVFYLPPSISFYRKWLFNTILYCARRKAGLSLITIKQERSPVIR